MVRPAVLVLFTAVATSIGVGLLFRQPATEALRTVGFDAALPTPTTEPLEKVLRSEAITQLEHAVTAAAAPLLATEPAPRGQPMPIAEHQRLFPRSSRSRIQSIVLAPSLVRAESLVRDPVLNPHDLALPASELALLESILSAHRGMIGKVQEVRDRRTYELALDLARRGGVVELDEARRAVPASLQTEAEAALQRRAAELGVEPDSIRLSVELETARRAIGADMVMVHAGRGYLCPQGTVLPHVADFDEFLRTQALAMLSDVLAVFLRNGALTTTEVRDLLASYEDVARRTR